MTHKRAILSPVIWMLVAVVFVVNATDSHAIFDDFLECGFSPLAFEKWASANGFQTSRSICDGRYDGFCIEGRKSSHAGDVLYATHATYAPTGNSDTQIEVARSYQILALNLPLLLKLTEKITRSISHLGMPDVTDKNPIRTFKWNKHDITYSVSPHKLGIGNPEYFIAKLALRPSCDPIPAGK